VNLRSLSAFLVFAFAPALALGAANPPPAPILNLANAVIRAANTDDPSGLAGLFTSDATVVDENPPFVWRGADAGTAWWRVVDAVMQKIKMTHLQAVNVRLGEFRQSAGNAYLVQAMTITGVTGSRPFAESGTMTFTFHDGAGKWLISTMVWTTKP